MSQYDENMRKAIAMLERLPFANVAPWYPKPKFNDEYPVSWETRKTCLSCGSKTQPCCGH